MGTKKFDLIKGQSVLYDEPSTLPERFERRALVCHHPSCGRRITWFDTRRKVAKYIEPEAGSAKLEYKVCPDCKLRHQIHTKTYIHILEWPRKDFENLGFDIVSESEIFPGSRTISELEPSHYTLTSAAE